MLKLCIGFVVFGVVFAVKQQNIVKRYGPSYEPFGEIPCLYMGGMCVVADECPKGLLAKESGLCPVQQNRGVECCYGISKYEKRCRQNGGECMPGNTKCPDYLTYKEPSDCQSDQKCCILVH